MIVPKARIAVCIILLTSSLLTAQATWQKMASLPGPGRHHAIAFSRGDKGYVLTGIGASSYKDFWEYNSVNNTWTKLADFPGSARSYGTGCVVGDKAYVGLGHFTSGNMLTDWWEYNFLTSTWTQKKNFPGIGRDHPAYAVLNGKIYMGFGDNSSGSLDDWWEYNPDSDTWTQKTLYPGGVKMHHPVTATHNGLIYMSQGHLKDYGINKGSKKFYSYNPSNDTWTELADMPGNGVVAGASFSIGSNKIYSGIGIEEPVAVFHKEFYEYDIGTNTWKSIASYPGNGVFGSVSFVIGNNGYVVTGQSSSGVNSQDLYKLSDITSGIQADVFPDESIRIYPNPAIDYVILKIQEEALQPGMEFTVFDVSGREVMNIPVTTAETIFSCKDLKKGFYTCQILVKDRIRSNGKLMIE